MSEKKRRKIEREIERERERERERGGGEGGKVYRVYWFILHISNRLVSEMNF